VATKIKLKKKSGTRTAAKKKISTKKKPGKTAASLRREAKNRRARNARLSRGLSSDRAGIVAESEPERTLEAGQSGDLEGLSDIEDADSESVRELAEEGQDYEAEIVEGVERAADRDEKQVRTDVDEEPRPRPKRQTL
jgi:hypothetical protein